jgi:hypothetical protein
MPVMRRRPLLRAAAVSGGAYYAGQRRAEAEGREREQEARIAGLEGQTSAAPEPEGATASASGIAPEAIERLRELGQLRDQGVLTDEEFAQQKARLLGG